MIIAVSANKALSIKRRGRGSKVFKVLLGDYIFAVSFFFFPLPVFVTWRLLSSKVQRWYESRQQNWKSRSYPWRLFFSLQNKTMQNQTANESQKKTLPAWTRRRPWSCQGQNIQPALESYDNELDWHPSRLKLCLNKHRNFNRCTQKHKRNMHD